MREFLNQTSNCANRLIKKLKQPSPNLKELLEMVESIKGDIQYLINNKTVKKDIKQYLGEILGEKTTIGFYELEEALTNDLNTTTDFEINQQIAETIEKNYKETYTKEELEDLFTK